MKFSLFDFFGFRSGSLETVDPQWIVTTPVASDSARPGIGLTVEVDLVRVVDGDTVNVRFRSPEVSVRLADCWAPEVRGKDAAAGQASRENLQRIVSGGKLVLHVPGASTLAGILSMGRVVGRIYDADGRDVSTLQVEQGHAKKTKGH